MKLISLCFIVLGGIMTITIIGAVVGIPMLCLAGWVHAKARSNIRMIEAAYQDYLSRGPGQATA